MTTHFGLEENVIGPVRFKHRGVAKACWKQVGKRIVWMIDSCSCYLFESDETPIAKAELFEKD